MEGRIYMPNNKSLREEILKEHHDLADIGHPGQQRMLELLKRTYWWSGLKEDIKKYMQGCLKCQQNKVQHQQKAGKLHPLEIPKGPWQEISIDMIGPLPNSNGMNAILVIMDRFMKMIRLKAMTMDISSEGIAKIYRNKIWKLHRVPKTILSDQGPQFVLKFMEEFTKVLGTKRRLSIAYYHQTNGQTERMNQEIGMFLRHYVNYQQDN